MLEVLIIKTRHFPFSIIIPSPIPPTHSPPPPKWFSFKIFLAFFFPLPSTESFTAEKER